MGFRRKLKVGSFHDGIDRTGLLAETAVDAFRHVDVIPGSPAGTVLSLLGVDGDGLRRAGSLTQLACDTTLISRGVPPQSMLATETWTELPFLKRVVDRNFGLHGYLAREPKGAPDLCHEEDPGRSIKDLRPRRLHSQSIID